MAPIAVVAAPRSLRRTRVTQTTHEAEEDRTDNARTEDARRLMTKGQEFVAASSRLMSAGWQGVGPAA
jgi:hypothetical protein